MLIPRLSVLPRELGNDTHIQGFWIATDVKEPLDRFSRLC